MFSVLLTLFSTLSSYDSENDAGTKRAMIFVSSAIAIIGPLLLTMLTSRTLRQHAAALRKYYNDHIADYHAWVQNEINRHQQHIAAADAAHALGARDQQILRDLLTIQNRALASLNREAISYV